MTEADPKKQPAVQPSIPADESTLYRELAWSNENLLSAEQELAAAKLEILRLKQLLATDHSPTDKEKSSYDSGVGGSNLATVDTERLTRKIEELSRKNTRLTTDIADLKDRLAYRLGTAIVSNLKPPTNWIKIPYALLRSYRGYRHNLRAKSGSGENRRRRNIGISSPPASKHLIWQSQELSKNFGLEHAVSYARRNQSQLSPYAANILEASGQVTDERWGSLVNEYLGHFGAGPISLREGEEPRFFRLSSPSIKPIRSDKLISIIMPAWNAEKTLLHSLESLLQQTWQDLEIIVVDDCSTDDTWQIAQSVAERDERVRLIRNSINVGPYVSKNRAIDAATGEWITGHDADDWAHPQRIEMQMAALAERTGIRAGIGQMLRMNEAGEFTFSKVGKASYDGVLRVASISCTFESKFLKRYLGHWDSVRFGADSEMIGRARILLGEEFAETNTMTMFCLNIESSLTNHPIHGVSQSEGISPSRRYYRDQWTAWHETLNLNNAHLDFPLKQRPYDAPYEAVVPYEVATTLIREEQD